MNEHLRDRILRKVETLPDERGYQVLDYVEFLESRYAERQAPTGSPFTRFAEAVEDRMRAGKVSANTIAEAMGLMNRAANVLNGALAAGRSMANDLVSTSSARPSGSTSASPTSTAGTSPSSTTGSSPSAGSASGTGPSPSAGTASGGGPSPSTGTVSSSGAAPNPGPGTMNGGTATPEASSPAHDTRIPGSPGEKL
jgi:hypothetical protein